MATKNIETMSVEEIGKKLEALGWEGVRGWFITDEGPSMKTAYYQKTWDLSEYEPSGEYDELEPYQNGEEAAPEHLYIHYEIDVRQKWARYEIYKRGEEGNAISVDDDYDGVLTEALQDTLFTYVGKPPLDILREPFSNELLEIYYSLLQVRKNYANGMVWWEKDQYVLQRHVNVNDGYTSYLAIDAEQATQISDVAEDEAYSLMGSIFGDEKL